MVRAILLLAAFLIADSKTDPGFKPLFNGKNLDGWKTLARKGKPSVPLDGKTEAFKGRFKVKDGLLLIDPKVRGDVRIETAKAYGGNVTIRFEFKPGPKCNNDLFFRGQKFDLAKGNLKNYAEGKWQSMEIVVKDAAIEFLCDGASQRKGKVRGKGATPLGIRAEFGELEIRNLRIKE